MRVFVLGANDPEMRAIAEVLKNAKERFAYAYKEGKRVHSGNAYDADGFSWQIPAKARIVYVECRVKGLRRRVDAIVDHHNPGDPGYDCGPEDYLKGSSLGQVLAMLSREPSLLERIICAADHCPQGAYQGLCPGVPVEAFSQWRIASKADAQKITVQEMQARVDRQWQLLQSAERITLAGVEVAWMPDASDELPDASARCNMPVMYRRVDRDGRNKAGILNAPAPVVEAWMRECDLAEVYGNPNRGYAGGYF